MRAHAVIIAATVTIIVNLVDALAPNTPNYYNRNECWDNDGVRFQFIERPADILAHIDEEVSAINAKNLCMQQDGRCLNKQQRRKIADKWSRSLTMLSTMVRSLGIEKLAKVNLPYDVCFFSEPAKRTLCAEGMKLIEQKCQRRKPVGADIIKELFKRHNYDCQSKRIGRNAPPINAVFCPTKFIFDSDDDGLGSVLDSYIDGFYFSQSTVVDNRLYLWIEGYNDELVPIVEINGIKLAKGSSISDIGRFFKVHK